MPDGYFENLPIPYNVKPDPTYLAETKADKSTTINGYDLSEDRTLFVQDIPSKNLLPNTATTQTINGVTFTVNDDGSVTVSGTASADAIFYLESENIKISAGSYVITSGQLSGASFTTHCLVWGSHSEYSNNGAFTLSSAESGRAYIKIASGQSFNGTFRPMIRLASVEDDTYVPYAKTNVELTQILAELKVKDIAIIQTVGSGYSNTIKAHSGIGKTINVTVPSGYVLIGHIYAWGTGISGILASFDYYSTSLSVPVYINNTTDNNVTLNTNYQVNILSLVAKKAS